MAESITEFITSAVSAVAIKSESTQRHMRGLRPPETPVLQNLKARNPTSYNSYVIWYFWGNRSRPRWMLDINLEGSE